MKLAPKRRLAVLASAVSVAVALSACGGSSSPSSTTAAANTQTGASGSTGRAPVASGARARSTALTACLKKYGVTVPTRGFGGRSRFGATGASGASGRFGPSGASGRFGATGATGARGGGFFGRGAFANNPKLAAAFAKCGGSAGGFRTGGAARGTTGFSASSTQDRTEVVSYVACMKGRGVVLPTPNFSGTGNVFRGVNTTTSTFRAANASCQGLLKFLSPSGATGAGGPPSA